MLVNHYNSPGQIAEVTHMLTLKNVEYAVAAPATLHVNDPIGAFIRRNYVQVERGGAFRSIWRRKAEPAQSID